MNQGPYDRRTPEFEEPPRRQYAPVRPPSVPPIVTYSILVITILIYILQEVSGFMLDGVDLPAALGMKDNASIVQGQYWRLITPVLLHGSILHIGLNMYALYIFGPGLERHYGRGRFLVLYLLSAFSGNVFSFVFSPTRSLGSSTAIFGLIAAQGVFLYQNRQLFGGVARQALSQILMIAAINLVIGLNPGIDNWGHMGGLVGGAMFAWLAGPLLYVEGISPYVEVKDGRETRSVVLAALSILLFFGVLAAITISGRMV